MLATLALLGAKLVHEQIRVYAIQSAFAAAFAVLVGIDRGSPDLIVLGALTLAIKSFLVPIGINRQITFQVAEHEVPLVIQVPMSLAPRRPARRLCLLVGFRAGGGWDGCCRARR